MRKMVMVFLGLAVLYAAIQQSKTAQADNKPIEPRTRVALFNLNLVIKEYHRYQEFQKSMKKEGEMHQKAIADRTNRIKKITDDIAIELDDAKKQELQKQALKIRREVEDITAQARRDLARKGSEAMVVIYKDVRKAARVHAKAHRFDLVLHYEEATTDAEMDTAKNIMRKMNAGGAVPLFFRQELDISKPVIKALNENYRKVSKPIPTNQQ